MLVSYYAKRRPGTVMRSSGNRGSRWPGSCAYSRPPRRHAALRCFAVPSWTRGACAVRARRLGDSPRFRPPSAANDRHLASTLRLLAQLRSLRPQASAPTADCGLTAVRTYRKNGGGPAMPGHAKQSVWTGGVGMAGPAPSADRGARFGRMPKNCSASSLLLRSR